MKKVSCTVFFLVLISILVTGQKPPSGNPDDFSVKTCLHSVSYSGAWRGQALLSVDEFLVKAKELGFQISACLFN
jgi:hypothetical protein